MADILNDIAGKTRVPKHIITQDDEGNVIVLEVEKTGVDNTDFKIEFVKKQKHNKTAQRKFYPRRERKQIYHFPKKKEGNLTNIESDRNLTTQSQSCLTDEIVTNGQFPKTGKLTVSNSKAKTNNQRNFFSVNLGKRNKFPFESKINILFRCHQCQECFTSRKCYKEHEQEHTIEKNRQKANEEYNQMFPKIMNPLSLSAATKPVTQVVINDIDETYVLEVIDVKKPLIAVENFQFASVFDETFNHDTNMPIKLESNVKPATITGVVKLGNSTAPRINQDISFKKYECSLCNQQFKRPDYLRDHKITAHGGVKPFRCNECNKGFIRKNVLINHMRSHTGERPFQCNQCDKSFSHKSNLRSHLKLHAGERPYMCEECRKTFFTKSNLTSHLKIHLGIKPHVCPQCDRAFIHMDTLKKHLMVHSDERPFKCKLCDKAFRRNTHLTIHMRHHNNDRPYRCEICDKAFFEKTHLQSHMTHHTGMKPFQCQLCDKSFCHRSTLNIHLQIHRGERLFHCSICKKSFCDKTTLVRHFRIHTGEKPFQCDVCNLYFRQSSNLKRHMRIHTGERPYGCPYCKKLFAQNINLTNHIRVHTGEKPFVCGTCNKAFTQRSNLISHQKSHMSGADDHIVEIYAENPKKIEKGKEITTSSIQICQTNISNPLGKIFSNSDDNSKGHQKLQIVGQKKFQSVTQNHDSFFSRSVVDNTSKKTSDCDENKMYTVICEKTSSDLSSDVSNIAEYGSLIIEDETTSQGTLENVVKIRYSKDDQGNIIMSIPTMSNKGQYVNLSDYEEVQDEHDFVISEASNNSYVNGGDVAVLDDTGTVMYLNQNGVDVTSDKQFYIETNADGDLNILKTNKNISERASQPLIRQDSGEYLEGSHDIDLENTNAVNFANRAIRQEMISEDVLRQVESYVVSNYNQETYDQLLSAAQQLPSSNGNEKLEGVNTDDGENNYISTHEETIESTETDNGGQILEVLQYAVSQIVEATDTDP